MVDKKTTRGRPRGFDKSKAEAAALALFWENGYEATGMAKLTSAIGVKAPSLYAAFGSKADLFARTVGLYQAECAPFFRDAFEASDAADFISALLSGAVESYTQPNRGRGCLVLDGTRNATDVQALAVTKDVRNAFHSQLIAKLSELDIEDPERIADACQTAMTGLSGAARHGLSRERLHDAASLFAAGILRQH